MKIGYVKPKIRSYLDRLDRASFLAEFCGFCLDRCLDRSTAVAHTLNLHSDVIDLRQVDHHRSDGEHGAKPAIGSRLAHMADADQASIDPAPLLDHDVKLDQQGAHRERAGFGHPFGSGRSWRMLCQAAIGTV